MMSDLPSYVTSSPQTATAAASSHHGHQRHHLHMSVCVYKPPDRICTKCFNFFAMTSAAARILGFAANAV
nr:hypothetical protein Itr_chr13CG09270 [Ipomoea trifida]